MSLENYEGSISLISGIKQANNGTFPLVDASAVQVDNTDKRLDAALAEKVDKVIGRQLSTENYTTEEKNKLAVSVVIKEDVVNDLTGDLTGKVAGASVVKAVADAIPLNSDLIEQGDINKYYPDSVANLIEDIKGTTQAVAFNPDSTVASITHKNASNETVRTDVFTYATNLITEVRTLSTSETITFKYHTDTLQTEVI